MAENREDFEAIRQIYTVLVLHFVDDMKQSDIALALMACAPLLNFAVFRENVAGLVLWSRPTMAPSTRSWMAWRPESGSVALTLTLTVPLRVAPAPGAVTVTTGGVVSGGAARKATVWCTQVPAPSRGALPV